MKFSVGFKNRGRKMHPHSLFLEIYGTYGLSTSDVSTESILGSIHVLFNKAVVAG